MLPLGAGILLWKKSTRPMRLLTGLLICGFLVDVMLLRLALSSINNMFLLHLNTVVSYLLIALLFSYWHKGRIVRYIRLSIVLFFICYLFLFGLGYEDLQMPNKYSHTIRSVLVAFISLYTLFNTFQGSIKHPASEHARFWVSLGAFVSYSGSTFVFVAIPTYITYDVWTIRLILAVLSNLLFFKGYLCQRR